jgi:phosphoribosylformylglycinamidine cyclo-ligase
VASSGLHANGASLARLLASRLKDGYATALPSGATLGEALLEPSAMYVGLVRELLSERVPLTYMSHITGHGLLKLMRRPKPLRYRIWKLPETPEVLSFLVAEAGLEAKAAYSTFNMGAGYALYCAAGAGRAIVELAARLGLSACVAGVVEEGPREVVLEPVGVRFEDGELELSA